MLKGLFSFSRKIGKRPRVGQGDLEIQADQPGFEAIGREFLGYLDRFCGLEATSKVLDIGCGYGRMAVPLTDRLQPPGEYQGFDVHQEAIIACQNEIEAEFPHFQFRHLSLRNPRYNPKGKLDPLRVRFPYDPEEFDVILLSSVFTHLNAATIQRYLEEISRVIQPDGRCLATVFLLNPFSLGAIEAGRSAVAFKHTWGRCRSVDPSLPETAVAVPEPAFLSWLKNAGLELATPIQYGSWSAREPHLSFQDVVILKKSPA